MGGTRTKQTWINGFLYLTTPCQPSNRTLAFTLSDPMFYTFVYIISNMIVQCIRRLQMKHCYRYFKEVVIGKVSSSIMGKFGAVLEVILILYPLQRMSAM